ncbi:hypothetical protein D3C78_991660 [compost metagenome]
MSEEIILPAMCACNDCLSLKPFSLERHQGIEQCACGGDFCGCSACVLPAVEHWLQLETAKSKGFN